MGKRTVLTAYTAATAGALPTPTDDHLPYATLGVGEDGSFSFWTGSAWTSVTGAIGATGPTGSAGATGATGA
jgi:hypothetical protein